MANMTLSLLIQAQDQASQVIRGVQSEMKDFATANQETFKRLGVIGGAGLAAIGVAVKKGRDGLNEYESATTRLTKILKTSTGASDSQVGALIEQASSLEKLGVASKENILTAQSQLATFDLQAETIAQLTPAILDYVIAEKGAAASSEDFKGMTNSLAQALNGNFASLTRVGFVLDDATKETIALGTESERAAALAEVLNSTYEGFNSTVSQTQEGLKVLRDRELNQLYENIATGLVPIIEKFEDVFLKALTGINNWMKENPEIAELIVNIATGAFAIAAGAGAIGLVLPSLMTGFGAVVTILSGPVGLVALIAGVVLGLGARANQSKTTDEKIIDVKNSINDLNLALANGEITLEEYNAQMEIQNGKLSELESKKRNFWTFLRDNFIDTVREVGKTFDHVRKAWELLSDFADRALNAFKAFGNFIKDRFISDLRTIASLIERISGLSLPSLSSIRGAISNTFGGARADGGPVTAGTSYLVGERGPELFTPSRSGQIIPNGGGSVTINMGGVTVANEADENRLVAKIKDVLTRETRDFNNFGILN